MVKRWVRRAAIFLAIIAALIIGFVLFLHTAAGKSMVRKKVQSYLQEKWKTDVLIGKIDYRLPNWISLEQVVIFDRNRDTLLSGGRLFVSIRLLELLSNTVDVKGVRLEDISLNCYRKKADSAFNFQFILDAFAPSNPKENEKPEESTPMQLSVSQLTLDKVRMTFRDQRQALYFTAFINDLSCLPDSLYPEKNGFHFNDFTLRNSQVVMVDSSAQVSEARNNIKSRGDPASLKLSLNDLNLYNVFFSYHLPADKTDYTFRVDSLQLHQASLDLGDQSVTTKSLQLNNSAVKLATWIPTGSNPNKAEPTSAGGDNWKFRVDSINLFQNSFIYHNAAAPIISGLDYQHINAQNINLQARESRFDSSGIFSRLDMLSLNYNNKLFVKRVSANFRYTNSLLHIRDVTASINQSQLNTNGDIVWPFKPGAPVATHPQFLIENLSLCYGDLLLIQPALKNQLPISLLPSEKLTVSGNLSGTLQNLKARQLSLTTSGKQIQFKGSIDFNAGKAGPEISATVQQLHVSKQILSQEIGQRLKKENVQLPEEIIVSGKLQVNAERLITNLKVNSSFGQLLIDGNATNIRFPKQLAYHFKLDALHFETGKWIGMDADLGRITGDIIIKGKGVELNNLAASTRMHLKSAVIKGYPFTNIGLEADLHRSEFTVRSMIKDPHLETNLDLHGHIRPGLSIQGTIQVRRADLHLLGLSSDSITYAGSIQVDASYSQPGKINAFIRTDSNQLTIRGKPVITDRLFITGKADVDSTLLTVNASFLDLRLAGNYPLHSLPAALTSFWQSFYPLRDQLPEKKFIGKVSNYRTSLYLILKQDSLLTSLLPEVALKQPLTIKAAYIAEAKDSVFSLEVNAPEFRYQKYEGRGWLVKADKVDSTTQFSVTGRELLIGSNRLTEAYIAGGIQNKSLLLKGRINDSMGKEYYLANVELTKEKDETVIRLLDDLTLNRNKWKVSSNNQIRLVPGGYIINQLALENRGQTITINTKDGQALSPIDIKIDSFDIRHLFTLLSQGDTLLGKGTVNADISILQPIGKLPALTGNLQATNLALFDIPIGTLHLHSNSIEDSLAFQGGLSGEHQLDFSGRMHAVNGGFHVQTHLEKFNTHLLKALAKDFLSELSGKITGDLQLSGSLDTPQYTGEIYLDSMAFALTALNTIYRINQQKLVIDYPDLRLDQFTIADSAGHPITLEGKATLFGPGEKKLDLSVETKDFKVLNSSRKPGSLLYGTGIIDAALAIKGPLDEPSVEGDAYLKAKSHVHFVSSTKRNKAKTRKDGILFVKIDTLTSPGDEMVTPLTDSIVAHTPFKGLRYNLNLKVDKEAEFSMMIDPSTNDELVLKGDARLNAGLGDKGQIGIEGVYNLQSGYYKMNNLLLRGRFLLVKGSTISFNGDPALAEADVTTEYVIEASPKGLLNYKDDDNAAYTQRVSFAVIFMIKGPLSKPVLSFDIKLKEGKAVLKSSVKSDVEHALDRIRSDVTEMNKQVFSLLLTKQFSVTTGTSTLESSNLNANNALKEGVSSFLTEAMNQVADQLIKGVDVDVNMKTYKTDDDPISKTDLGVAVSKDLFEDRLVIRVEESFAMGNSSAPVKSGSQYIPDITTSYKLSKDGRFQVKGYQKNEYDAVVQGYFTEVGINFTIELSYDKFKELLRRRQSTTNEKK